MQVTKKAITAKTCDDVWNWKSNVELGFKTLKQKRNHAKGNEIVSAGGIGELSTYKKKQINPELHECRKNAKAKKTGQENFVPPLLSGDKAEREAIRAYNKGREYTWRIDKKDKEAGLCNKGSWKAEASTLTQSDPNYVDSVLGKTCP